MTDFEAFTFLFRMPLRYRLPLPWGDFNREARRYVAEKRKRQINRLWIKAGKDFERFTVKGRK